MACGRLSPTSKRASSRRKMQGKKAVAVLLEPCCSGSPPPLVGCAVCAAAGFAATCRCAMPESQKSRRAPGEWAGARPGPALADLGSAPELKKACRWPVQRHRARCFASPVPQWGRQLKLGRQDLLAKAKPRCSRSRPAESPPIPISSGLASPRCELVNDQLPTFWCPLLTGGPGNRSK